VLAAATAYATDGVARDELAASLQGLSAALDDGATAFDLGPVTRHWLAVVGPDDERASLVQRLRGGLGYRRRAYQCWYLPRHSSLRRRLGAQVSVDVAAPPEAVWHVVSDPVRTPEWSDECRKVEFRDGATESGLGVRFRGANRNGRTTWSRVCTVFAFEPDREFGYLTSGGQGDAIAWHFRLEPTRTVRDYARRSRSC
jgi:hypothetical protein